MTYGFTIITLCCLRTYCKLWLLEYQLSESLLFGDAVAWILSDGCISGLIYLKDSEVETKKFKFSCWSLTAAIKTSTVKIKWAGVTVWLKKILFCLAVYSGWYHGSWQLYASSSQFWMWTEMQYTWPLNAGPLHKHGILMLLDIGLCQIWHLQD